MGKGKVKTTDAGRLGDKWKSENGRSNEFLLVLVLLVALLICIGMIFFVPVQIPINDTTVTSTDIIQYRENVLSIIIGAFGAWIGAGAAYFFGRENMREATQGMLKMRGMSPKERLQMMKVSDIPPKQLFRTWKVTDSIGNIVDELRKHVRWSFAVLTHPDGKLYTVIEEEAVWRYTSGRAEDEYKGIIIGDFLKFDWGKGGEAKEEGRERLEDRLKDIHVTIKMNYSVGFVSDLFLHNDKHLAIIIDDEGVPTHYITTAEINECLLKME